MGKKKDKHKEKGVRIDTVHQQEHEHKDGTQNNTHTTEPSSHENSQNHNPPPTKKQKANMAKEERKRKKEEQEKEKKAEKERKKQEKADKAKEKAKSKKNKNKKGKAKGGVDSTSGSKPQPSLSSQRDEDIDNSFGFEKQGASNREGRAPPGHAHLSGDRTAENGNHLTHPNVRTNLTPKDEKHTKEIDASRDLAASESYEVKKRELQLQRELEDLRAHIGKVEARNRDLLANVGSLMNKKMATDESDLENINVRNRPMKIMEDFTLFCSQEWLEAKGVLDDWVERQQKETVTEKKRCEILLNALMKCYEYAKQMFDSLLSHMSTVLHAPLTGAEYNPSTTPRPQVETRRIDKDLEVMMAKTLKESSDNLQFDQHAYVVAKSFFDENFRHASDTKLYRNPAIVKYFSAGLLQSWKMVLQQPPMLFVCTPEAGRGVFNELNHDLHYGSAGANDPGARIHYYIHPALHHGGKQMRKARVVLTNRRSSFIDGRSSMAAGSSDSSKIHALSKTLPLGTSPSSYNDFNTVAAYNTGVPQRDFSHRASANAMPPRGVDSRKRTDSPRAASGSVKGSKDRRFPPGTVTSSKTG